VAAGFSHVITRRTRDGSVPACARAESRNHDERRGRLDVRHRVAPQALAAIFRVSRERSPVESRSIDERCPNGPGLAFVAEHGEKLLSDAT
jgi:hypothetical protein